MHRRLSFVDNVRGSMSLAITRHVPSLHSFRSRHAQQLRLLHFRVTQAESSHVFDHTSLDFTSVRVLALVLPCLEGQCGEYNGRTGVGIPASLRKPSLIPCTRHPDIYIQVFTSRKKICYSTRGTFAFLRLSFWTPQTARNDDIPLALLPPRSCARPPATPLPAPPRFSSTQHRPHAPTVGRYPGSSCCAHAAVEADRFNWCRRAS